MTDKIRGVDEEKYAYYVNKLRQNVGLKTWKWRQIVTSQTAHTKYKWPPYDREPKSPMKIFCVDHSASHIRMTAKDIADVTLDWSTDNDISYEEEQKHESGEVVVVPAISQSTPAEQQYRRRGHQCWSSCMTEKQPNKFSNKK